MKALALRVHSLSGWQRRVTALLAGALAALAQPPFDFLIVCFFAFPVLVWLLDGAIAIEKGLFRRLLPAFGVGWWFGFGYFLLGLWWIGKALLVQADAYAWALPFAVLGLPALLAVFYGLGAVLARLLWSETIGKIAAMAFGFGAAEWLRATALTGFPWNAIGYAAMPGAIMMQSANIVGLFGMSALAVFVFSMPALWATGRHVKLGTFVAIGLVASQFGYGYVRLTNSDHAGKFLNLRIVQPAILQTEKWDTAEQARIFKKLLTLSASEPAADTERADVIVWPETAVPFLFEDRPDALVTIGAVLDDGQTLLTGAVRADGYPDPHATRYFNTVTSISSAGKMTDAVDKIHLVPFGEYVPFADFLRNMGVSQIVQSVGPFSRGGPRRAIILDEGTRILPFICYEAIFPQYFSSAAANADMILNVTNDAWFGQSPGPYQHFRQARLRAVESGLPLVRAANNGISAVVDAYGRIIDRMPLDVEGVLDVAVPLQRASVPVGNPGTNGPLIVLFFASIAFIWRIVRREWMN